MTCVIKMGYLYCNNLQFLEQIKKGTLCITSCHTIIRLHAVNSWF